MIRSHTEPPRRIHVLGASGSGTSTFGRVWSARFGHAHLDTDAFYWLPTDPPFTDKRPVPERFARLEAAMAGAEPGPGWILTGSLRNVSTVLRQPSRKMSVQKLFRHTAVEKPWTAAAAWKTLRLPPGLRVYTPRC